MAQKAQKALAEGASLGFVQSAAAEGRRASCRASSPWRLTASRARSSAAAKAKGLDPNVALANAQLESGMKPDAKNPTGSARKACSGQIGYQLRPVWRDGPWRRGGFDQGRRGANMADSCKRRSSNRFGRDPTPYDLRIAHWFGIGRCACHHQRAWTTHHSARCFKRWDTKTQSPVLARQWTGTRRRPLGT